MSSMFTSSIHSLIHHSSIHIHSFTHHHSSIHITHSLIALIYSHSLIHSAIIYPHSLIHTSSIQSSSSSCHLTSSSSSIFILLPDSFWLKSFIAVPAHHELACIGDLRWQRRAVVLERGAHCCADRRAVGGLRSAAGFGGLVLAGGRCLFCSWSLRWGRERGGTVLVL